MQLKVRKRLRDVRRKCKHLGPTSIAFSCASFHVQALGVFVRGREARPMTCVLTKRMLYQLS